MFSSLRHATLYTTVRLMYPPLTSQYKLFYVLIFIHSVVICDKCVYVSAGKTACSIFL